MAATFIGFISQDLCFFAVHGVLRKHYLLLTCYLTARTTAMLVLLSLLSLLLLGDARHPHMGHRAGDATGAPLTARSQDTSTQRPAHVHTCS